VGDVDAKIDGRWVRGHLGDSTEGPFSFSKNRFPRLVFKCLEVKSQILSFLSIFLWFWLFSRFEKKEVT
jgi:hypothetical protein